MSKEDNTDKYRAIKNIISETYVAHKLQFFYRDFLKSLIVKYKHLYSTYAPFPNFLDEKNNKTLRKETLIKLYAPFFTHEELFRTLMSELPKPIPELLERTIWGETLEHEWIEKTYKARVAKKDGKTYYQHYQELEGLYQIFHSEGRYRDQDFYWKRVGGESYYLHTLFLEKRLARYLKAYVKQPRYYDLEEVKTIPESLLTFNAEQATVQEYDIITTYINQGQLKMSASGKLLESSLYKAKKFCNLKEFFPEEKKDKILATFRTRMLAIALTSQEHTVRLREEDFPRFIKSHIVRAFQTDEILPESLLTHITGWHNFYYGLDTSSFVKLLRVIVEAPIKEHWVSVENLLKYVQLRDLLPHFTSRNYGYLKRSKKYIGKQEYYNDVHKQNYTQTIEDPFIRNTLAFFAAWGLLEIAYDKNFGQSTFAKKREIELGYLTPADSFEYFRFTNLGKYAFGLESNYTLPEVKKESIKLDNERLFLQYAGSNEAILNMINSVAKPIDRHLYKLSFETVLGDCNNSAEVALQIDMIKKLLASNPPKVWKDFFEALQQKSYSLENLNEEYKIFQLPENKELARLIARDDYLQKHIIKAEYYNILIRIKDIAKIKKHLKKTGFLIEFD